MIRISRCGFYITKSVPDIQTHSIFFHACAVAGDPWALSAGGGPRPAAGRGVHHQKTEIFRYYKKCAWHWDSMRLNGRNLMIIWTPLTLSGRSGPGIRGRGSISPGEGDGVGSNSLPRTIRIAVWEIFSGSSRSGKFFHRFSLRVCAIWEIFPGGFALQENNFGPKNSDSSRESAAAPPVRDSPKFFSSTILF